MENFCDQFPRLASGWPDSCAPRIASRFCGLSAIAKRRLILALISPFISVAAISLAEADPYYVYTPVKPLPGFDGPGIASGEFLFKSGVSFGVAYDSNIWQSKPAVADTVFYAVSGFDLSHTSAQHSEDISIVTASLGYAENGDDSISDIIVRANETYLVSPTSQITASAMVFDGYERRLSSNYNIPQDAAGPVPMQTYTGAIGYNQTFTDFTAGATFTVAHQSYDNIQSTSGAPIDQTYRDETDYNFSAFATVHVTPYIDSAFVFWAGHSEVNDAERDANLWKISNTTTFAVTSQTSVGFLLALRGEDYYNSVSQPQLLGEYQGFVLWNPTQRISVGARVGYHDLGVNYTNGISGGNGTYGALNATYLMWRNLQLSASLMVEQRNVATDLYYGLPTYQSTLEPQTWSTARVELTYELNSYAGISLLYAWNNVDTNSTQYIPYNENIFQTSFNLRF